MAIDALAPRSRRAVILGTLGAAAASVASAIGRPSPARAGVDGDVVLGSTNSASTTTVITGTGTGISALWGNATAASGTNVGVRGDAASGYGVWGLAAGYGGYGVNGVASGLNSIGVYGESTGGSVSFGVQAIANGPYSYGVYARNYGSSGQAIGVLGDTLSPNGIAIQGNAGTAGGVVVGVDGHAGTATGIGTRGRAEGGTGVHGFCGPDDSLPPAPSAKTGVYGRSDIDSSARGVAGYSVNGTGIYGSSGTGTAGSFTATGKAAYALKTSGRLSFAKVSGVATIAAGATSAPLITPGTDMGTGSYVLLTPQGDPGTRRFWATLDATANTITIRTNTTSASAMKVAWLLVG